MENYFLFFFNKTFTLVVTDVFLTFLNVQLLSAKNKNRQNKYVIGDCLGISEDQCLAISEDLCISTQYVLSKYLFYTLHSLLNKTHKRNIHKKVAVEYAALLFCFLSAYINTFDLKRGFKQDCFRMRPVLLQCLDQY